MPGIFLAAPTNEIVPHDPYLWDGSVHSWLDWQGNEWDLCSGYSGVALMGSGVRGLAMPPVVRYAQKSPAVAGSRWRGFITDEREVFWPIKVFRNTGSQDWLDLDRKWWQSMRPDKTGVWTVTQPGGESRSLELRFVDDGSQAFETLPERLGWSLYGITLVAEQPYWAGATEKLTWANIGAPLNFFGGAGADGVGTPFVITSSSDVTTATASNPGDVPSNPVWVVHGPTTLVKVGVGSNLVEVPFTVASGEWLVIDTAPTAQTALFGTQVDVDGNPLLSSGVDRTADLGAVSFASIPPGESVPISIQVTGAGIIELNLTPHYFRAW